MKRYLLLLSGILLLTTLIVIYQNDFQMEEHSITIPTPQGTLSGILTMPKQQPPLKGVIVFVHGDGPVDAAYQGGYRPLWERLATLGYASLSLDKPGIGNSEGNWLSQNMDDRAEETIAAIQWLKQQPEINTQQIGLWGASQAGWVIPKVAKREDLSFIILVSPAVNWIEQGLYDTKKRLEADGYNANEIHSRLSHDRAFISLLNQGVSYSKYLCFETDSIPISEDRFIFIQKNYLSDATNDLKNIQVPLLLMLGENDQHVDIKNTEQIYTQQINPAYLTIKKFPNAEHSMMTPTMSRHPWLISFITLFSPRSLTIPEYENEITIFLQTILQK